MKYLGYSELTKRIYILPASARKPKIDITDDVNEYIEFLKKPNEFDESPSVGDDVLDAADKYAFQVPYDGSNNFYDEKKLQSFLDGAKSRQPEIDALTKERDALQARVQELDGEYEINFGGCVKARLVVGGGKITVSKAMDGYGNSMDVSDIPVNKL